MYLIDLIKRDFFFVDCTLYTFHNNNEKIIYTFNYVEINKCFAGGRDHTL